MRKRLIAILVLAAALCTDLVLAVGQNTATGQEQPSNSAGVVAAGVGATADEALKDAFRDAVQQVMGTVVDANSRMEWDLFRVPQSIEGAIKATPPPTYGVTCVLFDDSSGEISRVTEHVRGWGWGAGPKVLDFAPFWRRLYSPIRSQTSPPVLDKGWWIGPVWGSWGTDITMSVVLVMKMTISSISQEGLARLAKTAVFLEQVVAKR